MIRQTFTAGRRPSGPRNTTTTASRAPVLQRKCACGASHGGGECDSCRARKAGGPAVEPLPPSVRAAVTSGGRPLDGSTRRPMEAAFGHDFTGVRVHTDARAASSAAEIGARAYTVGDHVVFGPGQHRPETSDGRRLLAHELAHVVQQSNTSGGGAGESALEHEADAAAESTARGERTDVRGRADDGVHPKNGHTPQAPPQPRAPTQTEQGLIDDARRAAAIRTQTALHRTGGIVPPGPPGRIDSSLESRLAARRLAQVMFQWDDPNMEQVSEVVSSMVNFLTSGTTVMVAPANDPDCGNRAAYVRGLRPPIVLCPAFFSDSPEQQIRTMIHEAAHLARIGSAALGESYCVDFDCQTSCGGFDSADSWAHYVHCLSGQTPDVPITITGTPGGSGGQQGGQQGGQSGGGGR
jgi:hypothetical protein